MKNFCLKNENFCKIVELDTIGRELHVLCSSNVTLYESTCSNKTVSGGSGSHPLRLGRFSEIVSGKLRCSTCSLAVSLVYLSH